MNDFNYQTNRLHCEDYPLDSLASTYGTPCFVYSASAMTAAYQTIKSAFRYHAPLICYAVKANSNLAILKRLCDLGAGFDIVSGGELIRVLRVGADPSKIVFSGVGKQTDEIEAALAAKIKCFNVESEAELHHIAEIAERLGTTAPISLRVNPDVDPKTHPYISTGLKENKFGIDINLAPDVYQRAAAMANISVVGVDFHIGSQLTEIQPFVDAMDRLLVLVDQLSELGIHLQHIDIGGGLGVRYQDEVAPSAAEYLAALLPQLEGRHETLVLEPGRSITANAGVLLTQVEYLKSNGEKNFAIVDAAMNDMLRPALYKAWMDIQPVTDSDVETKTYDVVGPVCETGAFLGKDRPRAITEGDCLCVFSAGAYGFVMSSNYNTRPRAAEIMVDGDQTYLVRARETFEDLVRGEQLLPSQ